MKRSNKFVVN